MLKFLGSTVGIIFLIGLVVIVLLNSSSEVRRVCAQSR